MFRVKDLLWLPIPVAIITLSSIFAIFGKKVEIGGYITLGLCIACMITIILTIYINRWRWVRLYKYTINGVHYLYKENSKIYYEDDIQQDQLTLFVKWREYYNDNNMHDRVSEVIESIDGVICLFRPEYAWEEKGPGKITRLVVGLAHGNFVQVGQGYPPEHEKYGESKPIDVTAHRHELSHPLLNNIEGMTYSEDLSHNIFEKVGV
jgi:hypothetical protein